MKTFWVSWYVPPIDDPEVASVWPQGVWGWFTGFNDEEDIICARVLAESESEAKQKVLSMYGAFSDRIRWRFVEEKHPGWWPPSDRFPLPNDADHINR